MAKLYFRYGAMGSSKTANAIMVQYNYEERGQKALMVKPALEKRDGNRIVASRSGLQAPCTLMEELTPEIARQYNCIIVDEAQFLTKEQVQTLVEIADRENIPVICYGLRADFQGNLFEGSHWLLARADAIDERLPDRYVVHPAHQDILIAFLQHRRDKLEPTMVGILGVCKPLIILAAERDPLRGRRRDVHLSPSDLERGI